MKSEKNILWAFILNIAFSIFEFLGGIFTGSIAILSDAVHDIGDAMSIGISYILEKKSKKSPDKSYTYGYLRYSVIGSIITMLILIFGSVAVSYNAIIRLIHPTEIHYEGMIFLAIIGVCVNFWAAFLTRKGDSLNQKAVNLHMLEDTLGWAAVLIGASVMYFTDIKIIDPILSICLSIFILVNAIKNLKEACEILLEKTPKEVDLGELCSHISSIDGVIDIHHIHIWSLDGQNHCATMHLVTNGDTKMIKLRVREELAEHGIEHVTLELESEGEICTHHDCRIESKKCNRHCHSH